MTEVEQLLKEGYVYEPETGGYRRTNKWFELIQSEELKPLRRSIWKASQEKKSVYEQLVEDCLENVELGYILEKMVEKFKLDKLQEALPRGYTINLI